MMNDHDAGLFFPLIVVEEGLILYSLLEKTNYRLGHPAFYSDLVSQILPLKKESLYWSVIDLKGEVELCSAFEKAALQPPASMRSLRRARRLADYVLDDKDELDTKKLRALIADLTSARFTFYADGDIDALIQDHIFRILNFFLTDPELKNLLKRLTLPLPSEGVKEIIRASAQSDKATQRALRVAFLSALLTPLRQTLGSCFATAPAIVIQQEEPVQLALDLLELLQTCRLRRVIEGEEVIAPMAATTSSYSAHDHPLLKVWEYTLATFSDYKVGLFQWNLHACLGLSQEEKGGIGELIYEELTRTLERSQEHLDQLTQEAEIALSRLRMIETLLRTADSESRARQLKAELQLHLNEFQGIEEKRNQLQKTGDRLSSFYQFLQNGYRKSLKENFQEVYDPALVKERRDLFSDSPAGFRLVYKHGRTDPYAWTPISTKEAYTDLLVDFFMQAERGLIFDCDWSEGEGIIRRLTSRIIEKIKSPSFVKEAQQRLTTFHRRLGEGIDGGEKTPWSYVAGGSMSTLIQGYLGLDQPLNEEKVTLNEPIELIIFLIEQLKELPWKVAKRFTQGSQYALLMSSPTHAFTLRPALPLFKKGWEDRGFTYTWVSDEALLKGRERYRKALSVEEQALLCELFALIFPSATQVILKPHERSIVEFRSDLLERLAKEPQKREAIASHIDSLLRRALPIYKLQDYLPLVQKSFPKFSSFDSLPKLLPFFGVSDLLKALALIESQSCGSARCLDDMIKNLCDDEGIGPSPALLFADTNWAWFFFGMVYNPGTDEWELWRLHPGGIVGYPMTSWQTYLKGGAVWSLITQPLGFQKNLPEFLGWRV